MLNDENNIFDRYKTILEAHAGFKDVAKLAKTNRRGISVMKAEEEIRRKDNIRRWMLEKAKDERKTYNMHELLGLSPKKTDELIKKHFGGKSGSPKNMLNPEPKILGQNVIPFFELPNKILQLNALLEHDKRKFIIHVYNILKDLYRKFGGDPDSIDELKSVRSGLTRVIERVYKDGITKKVLIPAVFGGSSKDDKFTHDYITNTLELEGANGERLAKIITHTYTGEVRSDREGKKSTQYKPEASNPENKTSNVSLGANVESDKEKKIIDLQNKLVSLKSDPNAKPSDVKKLESEINQLTKVRGKGTSEKSVTVKPIVRKESYVPFLRVIPF